MLTPKYPSFFDVETHTAKLTVMGYPLVKLNTQVNWEAFQPDLARVHAKEKKSNAGAKPIDVAPMFKMLGLQHGMAIPIYFAGSVVKYHEDHTLSGACIASLVLVWGMPAADAVATIWCGRAIVKMPSALVTLGYIANAQNILIYLIATQQADGHWLQN
ncbi:hypothetical protein [Candidatus Nitrotoga sp. AM1P]|uniref:hypothetical protein n=1 Tax=Candidatus Nitrotoga sp. AM1P TaxID=2559597 RepID=UPI0010BB8E7F|nr:hypothetical protein [Candidatus Nitrotoga sp. AM1P]BBJ23254.1 hypothetical protein W01_11810 [Candidatus Nitrotoga sp. AM1P]